MADSMSILDFNFPKTLAKMLGVSEDEIDGLTDNLDVDQLSDLLDACMSGDTESVRAIVQPNETEEKNEPNVEPKAADTDEEDIEEDVLSPSIGDKLKVKKKEATVKIASGPEDTVGVMINGELKMIDKNNAKQVAEGVIGMTELPGLGLRRLQELAGLPVAPAAPIDVPATPVAGPAAPPAPAPMAPEPEIVDEPGLDSFDAGLDDMAMDGAPVDPMTGDMNPMGGVGTDLGMGAPGAADPMAGADLPTPSAAVDALNDAEALDRAITEIEGMIPNVRISEYKTLVARLKALVAMADAAGKAALVESRMPFQMADEKSWQRAKKPSWFNDQKEKAKPTGLKARMAAVLGNRVEEEEEVDEGTRRAKTSHDFEDADSWLLDNDDEEHFDAPRGEDELDEAPQPLHGGTPKKTRFTNSPSDEEFDDCDSFLMGDHDDVHEYMPRRRHELDEDKFKAKDKEERKTLMDYVREAEMNNPNGDDQETLGDDRNTAIQSMQARMGDNTTPADATKAFDKMRSQGKIKQDGNKFTMDPMGDGGLNKSLQEGMEGRPTWELQNMVKALSLHPWLNSDEEKQRLADAKAELAKRKTTKNTKKK